MVCIYDACMFYADDVVVDGSCTVLQGGAKNRAIGHCNSK